ncbi:hypothetical protein [Streptomyces sp. NPDC006879]|uniref:hypothetical protein n=1 Tax=Streptomyces sp. NPDC006879 TaxID=3364767 RepID=UPI0036BE9E6D
MRETERERMTPAPDAGLSCPSCGRHVGTVVHRRKVLGAFVPEWRAGPCRNPECSAYVPEERPAGNEPG